MNIKPSTAFFAMYLLICFSGAVVFSACGLVWGTRDAGLLVSLILVNALILGIGAAAAAFDMGSRR